MSSRGNTHKEGGDFCLCVSLPLAEEGAALAVLASHT